MHKKYIQQEWKDTDGDGYWIALRPGYKSDSDPLGAIHEIVESTKRAAHAHRAIPCGCPDCKNVMHALNSLNAISEPLTKEE